MPSTPPYPRLAGSDFRKFVFRVSASGPFAPVACMPRPLLGRLPRNFTWARRAPPAPPQTTKQCLATSACRNPSQNPNSPGGLKSQDFNQGCCQTGRPEKSRFQYMGDLESQDFNQFPACLWAQWLQTCPPLNVMCEDVCERFRLPPPTAASDCHSGRSGVCRR